jgi:hypothetical protein
MPWAGQADVLSSVWEDDLFAATAKASGSSPPRASSPPPGTRLSRPPTAQRLPGLEPGQGGEGDGGGWRERPSSAASPSRVRPGGAATTPGTSRPVTAQVWGGARLDHFNTRVIHLFSAVSPAMAGAPAADRAPRRPRSPRHVPSRRRVHRPPSQAHQGHFAAASSHSHPPLPLSPSIPAFPPCPTSGVRDQDAI